MSHRLSDRPLATQAWSGFWQTLSGQLASMVLQVVFITVASRLLGAADFGAMAIAASVLRFVSYFAGLSVSMAILRAPALSPELLAAARTASTGLGLLLTLAVAASAPLAARIVHAPTLTPLIALLSLSLLVTATSEVALGVLRRELRFRELAVIDVVSYAVGYVGVGLALAVSGAGVYALAAAAIATAGCRTALLQWRAATGLRFGARRQHLRYVLGFGAGLSVLNFGEFISGSLPVIVLGRSLGLPAAGDYNRAQVLVQTPGYQLTVVVQRIVNSLSPRFSREGAATYLLHTYAVAVATVGVLAAAAGTNAGLAIRVLFGPGYREAAAFVPLVAAAAVLTLTTGILSTALEARGHLLARYVALGASLAAMGGGIVVAVELRSARAFAAAWLAGELVKIAVTLATIPRELGAGSGTGWRSVASAVTLIAFVVAADEGVGHVVRAVSNPVLALALVSLATIAAALTYLLMSPGRPLRVALIGLGAHKAVPPRFDRVTRLVSYALGGEVA